MYGFSPVCVISCRLTLVASAKALEQLVKRHLNGFSPVWMRTWRFSVDASGNDFIQPAYGPSRGRTGQEGERRECEDGQHTVGG